MDDDWQLLQDYAKRGSEAAFRALVERHLGFIHAAARRQVNDSQLAEEVTQAVFILLARKAGSFGREVVLPGWLFRTTRFVAARATRSERRRQQREREASEMQQLQSSKTASPALSPLLDEALARLGERDRNAVLLRFARDQSLREVGAQLGVSEEAAKKRVSRALERLRSFFAGRGYAVSVAALAGVLSQSLAQGAPAELAVRVLAKSLAGSSAGGTALPALAQETLEAWRWTRLKVAGSLTALLAGLVLVGVVLAPQLRPVSGRGAKGDSHGRSAVAPGAAARVTPAEQQTESARSQQRVLHFHVVAKDTGEPVTGAQLAVNTVAGGEWRQRFDLATDEKGTVEVPYPPGAGRLDVGVAASGWAARFATWRTELDAAIPVDYTLRVERVTNWMGGWLRDEKGKPVANAAVEMEFSASDMAQEENPRERFGFVGSVPVARSDQDGRWVCAVVDRNAERIPGLRARHPDFALARIAPAAWATGPDGAQSPSTNLLWAGKLVTTMSGGLKLTGRVVDEGGRPIAGAQVDHEPGSSEPLHTETDAQGRFAFGGLAAADFDFNVTARGFAQDYRKVSVQAGMGTVEVRLKAGAVLRLRLVDEYGYAVSGGRVALTGPAGIYMPGLSWSTASGPDGRVEWASAPANQMLNLCASRHPDFGISRGILVKADGEEHAIQLRRTFAVSGRVTDAETGEPVREVKSFPGYGEGEWCWWRGDTRHSTDGTFVVYFNQQRMPWRVRVEAEGYTPFVSEWLKPDSSGTLDVVLRRVDPSRTARGGVLRTDGQPAAGAEVALLSPEHGASLGRGARFTRYARDDKLIVAADAAGRFAFPEERNAHTVIAVCSNGFARVPVSDVKQAIEVRLQPWGRIEGAIEASTQRRPVKYVRVDDLLGLDLPGNLCLDSQSYYSMPQEDGRFAFDHVPPGFLCVWLDAGVMIEASQAPPWHCPTWVQVAAGATAQVTVAEVGYRVKGRFILPGREGDWTNQTRYALLDGDWPPEPATGPERGLNAKQYLRIFFDRGRLTIGADGCFESRDPLVPGTYRLLLTIGKTRFDQEIAIPDPSGDGLQVLSQGLEIWEKPVIDLGDIAIGERQ
jgi:RNA polymerase sigma factor (sigma-70 family)